jgi:hypothetical protein
MGFKNLFAMISSSLVTGGFYVFTMSVAKRRAAQESQVISIGGGEDLFVGMILESELMARFTQEYGVPGAPVLFGAQNDQLLSALFARKDDLLFGITLHVYLLRPFSEGITFMVVGKPCGCVEVNFTYLPDGHKMNEALL